MKNVKLKAEGFTLIELLVVIAIIGLLSSIVLASLSTARLKARDAAIEEDMVGIRTSVAIYFSDKGNYGPYFWDKCPTGNATPPASMFHQNGLSVAKSIHDAIQHIKSLTPTPNTMECAAIDDPAGGPTTYYSVFAELNQTGNGLDTNNGPGRNFLCLDNISGSVKTVGTNWEGLGVTTNGKCN